MKCERMTVTVNGEAVEVPTDATLTELLTQLRLSELNVAVERNQDVVPRARYGATLLYKGDAVEIVTFVGGG